MKISGNSKKRRTFGRGVLKIAINEVRIILQFHRTEGNDFKNMKASLTK